MDTCAFWRPSARNPGMCDLSSWCIGSTETRGMALSGDKGSWPKIRSRLPRRWNPPTALAARPRIITILRPRFVCPNTARLFCQTFIKVGCMPRRLLKSGLGSVVHSHNMMRKRMQCNLFVFFIRATSQPPFPSPSQRPFLWYPILLHPSPQLTLSSRPVRIGQELALS